MGRWIDRCTSTAVRCRRDTWQQSRTRVNRRSWRFARSNQSTPDLALRTVSVDCTTLVLNRHVMYLATRCIEYRSLAISWLGVDPFAALTIGYGTRLRPIVEQHWLL